MTRREAGQLAKRVTVDDPQCRVTDVQRWPSVWRSNVYFYTLSVLDTRTGYSFTVRDAEHWAEHLSYQKRSES